MSAPALLLRYLLIVTLCLDGSLSLWTASATAVTQVARVAGIQEVAIAEAGSSVAPDAGTDACADKPAQVPGGEMHRDCDCALDACDCLCVFSIAAISHRVPFLARHALTAQPVAWSAPRAPAGTRTAVFRPPIG